MSNHIIPLQQACRRTHLDLFSGIGGFALAARWTGVIETVGFCELDPWCQKVLAKHWPGVPIHDDITNFAGDALARFGRIDLITGGFPCQPFSAAGRRTGKDDDRYLWPAMAAVIAQARPSYVLVENSPRIRSMVLDDIFDDLEGLGYAVRAIDIPAGALGAPHRRHRMWTVAYLDGRRQLQPSGGQPDIGRRIVDRTSAVPTDTPGGGCGGWSNGAGGHDWDDTTQRNEGECRYQDGVAAGIADPCCGRYGASEESIRAGRDAIVPRLGRPPGPGVVGAVHGISNRVDRVRGLGNAIVPQVAYELMRVMFADEMAVA